MQLKERREVKVMIPTGPTADIAFLLIIFFILTTIFRTEIGLKLLLPEAQNTERILKSRNVANVYVDQGGRISVDDQLVTSDRIRFAFRLKVSENPELIVQLKGDQKAKYGKISEVLDALQEAQALRVVFASEFKK